MASIIYQSFTYLSVCLYVYYVYLSNVFICLSVCMPSCLWYYAYLFIYLSVCLSVCLFICLSVCLSANESAKLAVNRNRCIRCSTHTRNAIHGMQSRGAAVIMHNYSRLTSVRIRSWYDWHQHSCHFYFPFSLSESYVIAAFAAVGNCHFYCYCHCWFCCYCRRPCCCCVVIVVTFTAYACFAFFGLSVSEKLLKLSVSERFLRVWLLNVTMSSPNKYSDDDDNDDAFIGDVDVVVVVLTFFAWI